MMAMMVLMVMIMAMAFLIMFVVMMLVTMVVTVALLSVMMVMVVVLMLVECIIDACVIECMIHHMFELMGVYVEDSTHEREVYFLLGIEVSVLLDSVAEVRQVQSDPCTVIECDRSLDVSEHGSGFLLHPFTHLHKCIGEPGLCIRIVA